MEKANELLAHEVGNIINRIVDKNKGSLITVTAAECSKDLRSATIWISILGSNEGESLELLNEKIYEIQGLLNKRLRMKYVPRIRFRLDQSQKRYDRIERLLKKGKKLADNNLDKKERWL